MVHNLPTSGQTWLASLAQQGKSRSTQNGYARGLQHFVQWYEKLYLMPFDPGQVMPRDVRDWKAYQQQLEQAAPATINQRLVAVKRFFQWLRKQKLCLDDPTEEVMTLRLGPPQIKALSDSRLRRLLRAARGQVRDYAVLEVLAGTGIRIGELLSLQVGDVELQPRSGRLTVRYGKGGHYRQIPLTLDVRQALSTYLAQVHALPDNPIAPLWWSKEGRLSHRSSVTRMIEKYALQAGLEAITPHQFRHTFATRYLAANPGDVRGLARLLGHASLDTIMIYTEPALEELAARMDRMDSGETPSG